MPLGTQANITHSGLFYEWMNTFTPLGFGIYTKKQLCLRENNENRLVCKLHDLTPEQIKIVGEFNERKS